ncbi:MAG TPA: class I SAM-dependent methyltransferase [Deltaproteobacteria bacterium]|nr:class I SAM-dependent methyltransferase [Deltaproteobacteria bacterium]
MEPKTDLAGKNHWNTLWRGTGHEPYRDVYSAGLFHRIRKYPFIHLMKTIASRLKDSLHPGAALLEIGCGGSQWLPTFARRFGVDVTGIDYSEQGCASARAILDQAGVQGRVVQADLFDPPADMVGRFDLVVSFGVLEHFPDTARCLDAMAGYLKPSGCMVTVVPNMTGMPGWLQKVIDPAVYAMHVPLTRQDLLAAHADTSMEPLFCDYSLLLHLGVVNMNRLKAHPAARFLRYAIVGANLLVQAANMVLSEGLDLNPCDPITSPYLMCISRKGGPVHV